MFCRKPVANLMTQQDHAEHQRGDQQITRGAEIRRGRAAAGPVDANARQHHPDHGDDRAGDDRREEPQHIFDERRDAQPEHAADQDRAVNSGQADAGHRGHRQHRRDRHRRHAHDDRQPNAERADADGLDQGRDPAGEQIGVDQHRDLILGQMKRAAEDQRDRNGIGVHHQNMLQASANSFGTGRTSSTGWTASVIERLRGYKCCMQFFYFACIIAALHAHVIC